MIDNYKIFNNVKEDKIYKFSDYNAIKYNGNVLVDQIMEWLRAKLLVSENKNSITVPLETFFKECSVDKDKFMTFYNEHKQTQKIQSFDITINKNNTTYSNITFDNFRKVEENKKN